MYFEDYDEPYYEPTEADEIFREAVDKLQECLKQDVKNRINQITQENTRLREQISKYEKREKEIIKRERDVAYKEETLERDFVRKKFDDVFEQIGNQSCVWICDYTFSIGKKCDRCDSDRLISYVTPMGRKGSEKCECGKEYKVWFPMETFVTSFTVKKNGKKLNYELQHQQPAWYDDDSYVSFHLKYLLDSAEETNDMKEYDIKENTAFTTKEECQKVCDKLNADVPADVMEEFYKSKEVEE